MPITYCKYSTSVQQVFLYSRLCLEVTIKLIRKWDAFHHIGSVHSCIVSVHLLTAQPKNNYYVIKQQISLKMIYLYLILTVNYASRLLLDLTINNCSIVFICFILVLLFVSVHLSLIMFELYYW